MKSLIELLDHADPAWPLVQAWCDSASNPVEVLPRSSDRDAVLLDVQVTTRSVLGAIAYNTGGVLLDSGWLRLLGSGHPRLPRTLPSWNKGRTYDQPGEGIGYYLVADDVVGGFFAINGGGLGEDQGTVYYAAPDSLRWESLERGYADFVHWCLTGDLAKFYETFRWHGWEAEVSGLPTDKGLFILPPLFASGPPVAERSRGPVPVTELYDLFVVAFPEQLGTHMGGVG
jgi:hypothetical protein